MEAKEKANELVNKFSPILPFYSVIDNTNKSIKCALIAVAEILDAIDWHELESPNNEITFWEEVKNEINKL